jgi:hypothetical protein
LADNNLIDGHHGSLLVFQQFQSLYENNLFDKLSNDVRKMFHIVYKSHDVVLNEVGIKKPLLFVYLKSKNCVACYSRSLSVEDYTGFLCLNVGNNFCYQQTKMYCWQVSIDADDKMSIKVWVL